MRLKGMLTLLNTMLDNYLNVSLYIFGGIDRD